MAGKKYKPLIIGKSKRPRCLNNFNPAIVGVDYTQSKRMDDKYVIQIMV